MDFCENCEIGRHWQESWENFSNDPEVLGIHERFKDKVDELKTSLNGLAQVLQSDHLTPEEAIVTADGIVEQANSINLTARDYRAIEKHRMFLLKNRSNLLAFCLKRCIILQADDSAA